VTSDFDPPPPASWYAPASDAPKGGTRVHVSWLIAALAAALCLGLGGLAVGYYIGDHHEQISAAIKGTQAPAAGPPCEAKSAPSVIYKTLLVMLLPAPVGSQKPTGVNAAQELSLNAYVQQLYSDPAYETPRLRARCFQGAVHRWWATGSGQIVSIYLIQFGSPVDARSYALATEAADLKGAGNTIHAAVPGVLDGVQIGHPALDNYGNTLTRLIGDWSSVVILIHVYEPAHLDPPAKAVALLRNQAARI